MRPAPAGGLDCQPLAELDGVCQHAHQKVLPVLLRAFVDRTFSFLCNHFTGGSQKPVLRVPSFSSGHTSSE